MNECPRCYAETCQSGALVWCPDCGWQTYVEDWPHVTTSTWTHILLAEPRATPCTRGLDAAHELLRTTQDRAQRGALKDVLFLCHYGTPPCYWTPAADTTATTPHPRPLEGL